MKVYFIALFFVFGCAAVGTHQTVESSSMFKPKWTKDEISWTKGKTFYTTGYVSDVYDRAIGERQALLSAYSNLILNIHTKARTEMQSMVVGDNRSEESMRRLFRSTEALVSDNIDVFGATVKDRYWRKIKVKEKFGTVHYIYDCYVLLRLDVDTYNKLVALASELPVSNTPNEFLVDALNKAQGSIQ